jgi:hypothetical protein
LRAVYDSSDSVTLFYAFIPLQKALIEKIAYKRCLCN